MKTMTCKQLGGACEEKFHADTFEEMAEISKTHGMEMYNKGDIEHLKAMEAMNKLMANPEAFKDWFDAKEKEFDDLPEE